MSVNPKEVTNTSPFGDSGGTGYRTAGPLEAPSTAGRYTASWAQPEASAKISTNISTADNRALCMDSLLSADHGRCARDGKAPSQAITSSRSTGKLTAPPPSTTSWKA